MRGGRVARTIVSNCQTGNIRQYGAGIYASAGMIDNCLVTGCTTSHHKSSSNGNAAVLLSGTAKMFNSTVTKNRSCLVSGVWVNSTSAQAVNCAVYGNTLCSSTHPDGCTRFSGCFATASNPGTTVKPTHTRNLGDLYVNCASESEPYTEGCVQLTASPFADFENGDYTVPDDSSPIANSGSSALALAASIGMKDLLGNERYSGTAIDIGAYELLQGFSVTATPDRFRMTLSEGGVVNFTAAVSGASGDVIYSWNFGDGTTLQTNETQVAHEYTTPGHYAVSVTANDGSSSVTYELPHMIDVYGISFTCSVSATTIVTNRTAMFTVSDVSTEETVTYYWDFGDGIRLTTTDVTVEHVYTSAGSYDVSVYGVAETAGDYEFAFAEPVLAIVRDLYADASNAHPAEPYDSWDNAATSVKALLAYAAEGCVIHIKAGTYTRDNAANITVDKAVSLIGEGDSPADVVIPGNANDSGNRNMTVSAEGALVCNLTLYGGFAGQNSYGGGNLYLSAGTVSNCVLSSGRAHNNNSEAGGAKVLGGLLTHCVITNSWNRNRGNGIVLVQSGGRVSNCLITRNWKSFDPSRNSISLVYVSGGVMDNCTIANCWIMYNTNEGKYQTTDQAVNVTGTGKAYNCAIADINYVGYSSAEDKVVDYTEKTPQRWAGTAANFVNCATDDAAAINETCVIGTLAKGSLFEDYANGNLMAGPAVKNKGAAIDGVAFPSVDLAGMPRIHGNSIDIGCFERQAMCGMTILFR